MALVSFQSYFFFLGGGGLTVHKEKIYSHVKSAAMLKISEDDIDGAISRPEARKKCDQTYE